MFFESFHLFFFKLQYCARTLFELFYCFLSDFAYQLIENLADINLGFCRCAEIRDTELFGNFFRFKVLHLAVFHKVELIPSKHKRNIRRIFHSKDCISEFRNFTERDSVSQREYKQITLKKLNCQLKFIQFQ